MEQSQFSNIQMDALREVSNIGTGNAATALSMMLGKKIDMTVPSVNMIEFTKLLENVGEQEVTGIVVRVLGDIPGSILIVFERDVALNVIDLLTGSAESEFTELGNSVMCELGNILSGAYMNAISQFTGLSAIASVPAVTYDMLSAILATTFVESGQYDEYILDIETIFLNDNNDNIGAHFFYIPVPGSIDKILKTIGLN
ncbi:chemotaxis protein CheC [Clostridium sp. SHJSY1]|uniref:chemotaxis protein CheC n=1 Tax=Clostridium sp. SHJSY1 TaxID=2942483 RepID=UPI0028765CD9|nr:chemotaxis protein CheC [Clostridium sp. SHJSY1]MDS0524131.1 chemotaxis protein CheC [Clostridium sp. SHJSY1]